MSVNISATMPNTKIFDQNWHEIKQKTRLNRNIEEVVGGTLTALGTFLLSVIWWDSVQEMLIDNSITIPAAEAVAAGAFSVACGYFLSVLDKPDYSSNEQLERTKNFLLSDGCLGRSLDCFRRPFFLDSFLEEMKKPHLVDEKDLAEARRRQHQYEDKTACIKSLQQRLETCNLLSFERDLLLYQLREHLEERDRVAEQWKSYVQENIAPRIDAMLRA